VKLICMAPKPSIADAPMNTGPVNGVNTSDRNNMSTDGRPATKAADARSNQGNGNSSSNGDSSSSAMQTAEPRVDSDTDGSSNGDVSNSGLRSQLNTEVGSLKLSAPGTSRRDTSDISSEDASQG